MRALTVKMQLVLLIAITLSTLVALGYTGYHSTSKQGESLLEVDLQLSALRNQMLADMMHDAIRGDVLNALYLASSHGANSEMSEMLTEFDTHHNTFQQSLENTMSLQLSSEIEESLQRLMPLLNRYATTAREIITLTSTDLQQAQALVERFDADFDLLATEMEAFSDMIEIESDTASLAAMSVSEDSLSQMTRFIVGSLCIILFGAFFMLRGIMKPIYSLKNAIDGIRGNRGTLERLSGFTGEFRDIETSFNGVLDDLEAKRREESERAEAAFRVQQALNGAATSMVLTDATGNIIYINDTALKLFRQHEAEIRRSLPDFATATLVGSTLARLFSDARMANAVMTTQAPRLDDMTLGSRVFQVNSSMVRDEQGNRLGIVCEWYDKTEQREAERQIETVLGQAINGHFDARLDISHFRGFLRVMAESVNAVLDALTVPIRTAAANLQQIAEGRIPAAITTEFKGEFNEIRNNLNTCGTVLKALFRDTQLLVSAAQEGRLDQRVDVSAHWGDYRGIVEGMNNTLDAIAQPVSEVKTVISGFASGDLTQRMKGNYSGDFAILSEAVNQSIDNLVDMVNKITAASFNINGSATEISTGNQNLNDRTQEQAAALEQTTSTLTNLTSRADENTNNAANANRLAQSATLEARKGGDIVNRAVEAMSEIDAASKKIADIISVIDGIAFQTNLLALNASVEAARAGDQGKGFAVVANEVRALAGRSATAAQEIKLLINDTVGKVNHGTKLVNESGGTLRDIVDSISKVGVIISEISSATSDQLTGFHEVGKAITQLDDMTQQNAAMVEEAAAASESMAEQSETLRELMRFFKTEGQQLVSEAPKATPAKLRAGRQVRAVARTSAPKTKSPALKVVAGNQTLDSQWDEF